MNNMGYGGLKRSGVQQDFPLDKMSIRCSQAMDKFYKDSIEAIRLLNTYAEEGEWCAYLALAQIEDYCSNYDKASVYMEKAYELNPDNKQLKKWLGVTYYHAYKRDKAEEYLLEVAEQGDLECQILLGDYYSSKGLYDKAVVWYTKASMKNVTDTDRELVAHSCLELASIYKNGYATAPEGKNLEYYYNRAYKLYPTSKKVQQEYKDNVEGAVLPKEIIIGIIVIGIIIYALFLN